MHKHNLPKQPHRLDYQLIRINVERRVHLVLQVNLQTIHLSDFHQLKSACLCQRLLLYAMPDKSHYHLMFHYRCVGDKTHRNY